MLEDAEMANLLTAELREKLLENGRRQQRGEKPDAATMVKFFIPTSGATWLITELDPDEPDIAFGLCDHGMGSPELGNVLMSELESDLGPRHRVERDLHFTPSRSLEEYADEARSSQRIVT